MAALPHTIGKYRILAKIASGSFGQVYRAEDTTRQNYSVAIKILHAAPLSSLQERSGFLQEAQLLTMLRHPYIIPILDVGIEEGTPYLVMEYAPHGSLGERLKRLAPRPLPVGESLAIIGQVGSALQYAHRQNVIHRDLKPANILFDARGEALLADFGIATMLAGSMKLGTAVGTPHYMAPEQFRGTISKEGDQYALACIAYHMLTGRPPFDAQDFFALGFKHMDETPISPTQLNVLVTYRIETAILKALAKDRLQRFPDVESFVTALGAPLFGNEEQARPSASAFLSTLPSISQLDTVSQRQPSPIPDARQAASVNQADLDGDDEKTVASSRPRPSAPGRILEVEGQPATPGRNPISGQWPSAPGRILEVEGQSPLVAGPLGAEALYEAPTREHVQPDVLPHEHVQIDVLPREKPGLITPYIGAMTWSELALNQPVAARDIYPPAGTMPAGASAYGLLPAPPPPADVRVPAPAKQRRLRPFLLAAICALLVVVIGGGLVYALVGPPDSPVAHILPLPVKSQVTVTPKQAALATVYTLSAIIGQPDRSKAQVQARWVDSTSSTEYASASATGHGTDSNNAPYTYITQGDLHTARQNAYGQWYSSEVNETQNSLKNHIKSSEHEGNGLSCQPDYAYNHMTGDHAASVIASIYVTCTIEVYDYIGARSLASSMAQQWITSTPSYKQLGKISTTVISAAQNIDGQTIDIKIATKGAKIYSFSNLQALRSLIAGKTIAQAQTILAAQDGVALATVKVYGGDQKTLPTNTNNITITETAPTTTPTPSSS